MRPTIVRSLLLLPTLLATAAGAAQDPQPPTLAQGRVLLQQQDFEGAEEVFRALTASQPDNGQAWLLLGYSLHAQDELTEALEIHKKAASFPAVAARATYNAACVYARRHDPDAALAWMGRSIGAGFTARAQAEADPDLAPLLEDPRWETLWPVFLEGPDVFLEPTRVLHTFVGERPGDQFGWVARNVGDLDGDGVEDFASTAPTAVVNGVPAGRAYVYSSRSGQELFRVEGGGPGARLGTSVAGRADVDGDGTPDVLVGAPGSATRPGEVLVLSGKGGGRMRRLSAGEPGDAFGLKCGGIEDLDGDGRPEIVVGASSATVQGAGRAGRVYVYGGGDGELLWTVDGEAAGDWFGCAADATLAGGHKLLIVGAMKAGPRRVGRCYVYRCSAEGAEPFFTIEPDATAANLGQYFVTVLGDVDGDGVPDLFASDWNNSAAGPQAGRVYVHSGATGERILTVDGHRPGEGFGTSASYAGDWDGDGRADLIVGAWQNNRVAPSAGACYLYSGATGELVRSYTGQQSGDTLGFDAVGLGDVDGDGAGDFLLTAAWSGIRGARSGRVFIVAGPAPEAPQEAQGEER